VCDVNKLTSLLPGLNIAQLRIIRSCLLFSKPHFQEECPELLKDLVSALGAIDGMIQEYQDKVGRHDP
jgi:hypothetical protein